MKISRSQSRTFTFVAALGILLVLLSPPVHARKFQHLDFGLPLFGQEEIRLEKGSSPSFNDHLVKKYLEENSGKTLARLHGIFSAARLISLVSPDKRPEFIKEFQNHFPPPAAGKNDPFELLSHLFFQGLILAEDETEDPKNTKDTLLEDQILHAEEHLKDSPEYWLVKGILFERLRDRPNGFWHPMKPLEDLKVALKLAPEDPHFHFVLGQAFRLLGNDEGPLFFAVVAFEKAAAFDPGNHKLQNTVLGIYMGIHEDFQNQRQKEPFWMEEAVYKKILTLSPNNPYALNNLAYLYSEHGIHRQTAQQMAQKAVNQFPKNPGFRDTLGWAAFKNQQYDKAIAELKKSLSLNPDSYEANYHLGTVHYVKKELPQAIEAYEKAVQLNPNSAEALNNYAYLLSESASDLEKAKNLAERANTLEPNNPSYVDTLGWVEYQMGNFEEAARHLKKAFQLAPDVGEILLHLGKVHIRLNDFELGLNYLKQAIKADPNLENSKNEIFLALNLSALHQNLAEYHKIFQEKADPAHVKAILVQIARVYQDEGLYADAIDVTQLCEQIRRRELPLDKPIFKFYSFPPPATPTANVTVEGEGAAEKAGQEASPAASPMPGIARIPMALNLGPVVFRTLARRFQTFSGFETLSLSIFLRDLIRPYSSAVIKLQVPGNGDRPLLDACGFFLQLLRCRLNPLTAEIPARGYTFRLGRFPMWVIQRENTLFLGAGAPLEPPELDSLLLTFPYTSEGLAGMIMDWEATCRKLPVVFGTLLPNPLGRFQRIYGLYRLESGLIRESSYLATTEDLNRDFMKEMAEDLFVTKALFLERGIQTEVRVEAADGEVHLTILYKGVPEAVRAAIAKYRFLLPLLEKRINPLLCTLRRFLFGGDVSQLPSLCPEGGEITLDPGTGILRCSHSGHYFAAFPLVLNATNRCAHSRTRIKGLLEQFLKKSPATEIGGLINQLLLDYNILPCPLGGNYYWKDQSVRCTACHGPESEDE
jgi:tetratricopeptide (TPR) repeat protein